MRIHVIGIVDIPRHYLKRLQAIGEVEVFSTRLNDPDLAIKLKEAEILVIQPRLHIDVVPYLDRCRLIAVMATGYDAINVSAARQKGIIVCNVPEYASYAVAEYFLALVLALAKKLFKGALIMKERCWHHPAEYVGISLKGKILGLFGFGNIARKILPIAEAVGMNVISNTRCPEKYREQYRNVSFVTFEELLRESDVLGLAAAATPETHGIFNKRAFEMMKFTAFFINTARGALVNEEDLAWALNNELIGGAALDVFQEEPPKADNPLLSAKNIILTPHSAWAVAETVEALWEGTVGNVEAFVAGKLINEVFERH